MARTAALRGWNVALEKTKRADGGETADLAWSQVFSVL